MGTRGKHQNESNRALDAMREGGVRMKSLATIGVVAAFLTGCSEAGPFVKNVYISGNNVLTVEKCTIHNGFFVLSEENCSTETFKVNR